MKTLILSVLAFFSIGFAFGQSGVKVGLCDIETRDVTRKDISVCGQLETNDSDWKLVSFGISHQVGRDLITYQVEGNKLPETFLSRLSELEVGSKIFFEHLVAINTNGETAKPKPVELNLLGDLY